MADASGYPERGDVYRINFQGANNELRGPHYAVVVAEYPFTLLSTIIVIPFSSHARSASYHPETTINGSRTRALVEQIAAVSRSRLREPVGSLAGTAVMSEIDECLRQALGLEES
jgi:mRNA interferase MazF